MLKGTDSFVTTRCRLCYCSWVGLYHIHSHACKCICLSMLVWTLSERRSALPTDVQQYFGYPILRTGCSCPLGRNGNILLCLSHSIYGPSHHISSCTSMGQSGNIPNCTTPHALDPTVHPIPMYHGKEGTELELPKVYHAGIPLSISSLGRVETSQTVPHLMPGKEGTVGTVPPPCLHPTAHPIPMYHGKEGTELELPKLYYACIPLSIPSQCTWEGRARVGTSKTVPPFMSIPSQCTMGRKGQSGNIPNCTTLHACHPNVH